MPVTPALDSLAGGQAADIIAAAAQAGFEAATGLVWGDQPRQTRDKWYVTATAMLNAVAPSLTAQPDTSRTRISCYLSRTAFDEARAAFIADFEDAPTTSPRTFKAWAGKAVIDHANRTPAERAALRAVLPRNGNSKYSVQVLRLAPEVFEKLDDMIRRDHKRGRDHSPSAAVAEAIRVATMRSRARRGGTLPPPPERLPRL